MQPVAHLLERTHFCLLGCLYRLEEKASHWGKVSGARVLVLWPPRRPRTLLHLVFQFFLYRETFNLLGGETLVWCLEEERKLSSNLSCHLITPLMVPVRKSSKIRSKTTGLAWKVCKKFWLLYSVFLEIYDILFGTCKFHPLRIHLWYYLVILLGMFVSVSSSGKMLSFSWSVNLSDLSKLG